MTTRGRPRRPRRDAGPPSALWRITTALVDRKAVDLLVLDVRQVCAAADYFVIASGTSEAHVRGMAERLLEGGPGVEQPHHVEGLAPGRWVLLDYVDVVVHVFHPAQREFYQLERLWGDAPTVALAADGGPSREGATKG